MFFDDYQWSTIIITSNQSPQKFLDAQQQNQKFSKNWVLFIKIPNIKLTQWKQDFCKMAAIK